MRSDTAPKTERRILAIFWSTLLIIGILAVCRVHSIHVTTVRRKKEEDGSVVFFVEVTNPTDQPVNADIGLSTYACPSEGCAGWTIGHAQQAEIAASQTSVVEFRFTPLEARLINGSYSASVLKTEPIQKVATANHGSCICP